MICRAFNSFCVTDSLTHSLTDIRTDFIICPMLLMHWADNYVSYSRSHAVENCSTVHIQHEENIPTHNIQQAINHCEVHKLFIMMQVNHSCTKTCFSAGLNTKIYKTPLKTFSVQNSQLNCNPNSSPKLTPNLTLKLSLIHI